MNRAVYYKGLTFEYRALTPDGPFTLLCDGQPLDVQPDQPESAELKKNDLQDDEYCTLITTVLAKTGNEAIQKAIHKRDIIKKHHEQRLMQGVAKWNEWRRKNSHVRPLLYNTDFKGKNLEGVNFSNANLIRAELTGDSTNKMNVKNANFHEANLGGAKLYYTDLTGANFCRTDLYKTNLTGATLKDVNLQGTQLAMTNFNGATLENSTVYGIATWELENYKGNEKDTLRVILKGGGEVRVKNLQVAQFIFLLLNNPEITTVINEANDKVVLILGRFKDERIKILEAIESVARKHNLVPIIFNFAGPDNRDYTETIQTLAGLAKFVIADVTAPRSVPLELHALVPHFAIPFVPIFQKGDDTFSMLKDLVNKYSPWVLPPLEYESQDDLIEVFNEAVLEEVQGKREKLQARKAPEMTIRTTAEFLKKRK